MLTAYCFRAVDLLLDRESPGLCLCSASCARATTKKHTADQQCTGTIFKGPPTRHVRYSQVQSRLFLLVDCSRVLRGGNLRVMLTNQHPTNFMHIFPLTLSFCRTYQVSALSSTLHEQRPSTHSLTHPLNCMVG